MKHSALLALLLLVTIGSARGQQSPWHWVSPTPQGNLLNGIFSVNKDTLVAVGDLGTILRSSNGGSTWEVKLNAAGVTDQLFATFFVSGSTGWAVGEVGRVLKTTDAGGSWFPQSPPTQSDLFALYFASPATGWVLGANGSILKTIDGGTTWSPESSGTTSTLYGITFTSATNGFAVGTDGTILATTNGGSAWKSQTSGSTQSFYGVQFVSSTVGFVVGSFGTIYRTINGGSSWTPQTSNTDMSLYGLRFISGSTGWAAGAYGTVVKTTNGGLTWFAQSAPTYNDLFGIQAIGSGLGWAVGDFGTMIATTDGGVTWTSQSSSVKDNLNDFGFATPSIGWGVGDEGTIAQTKDGGNTWQQQTSGVIQNLYGATVLNSGLAYAEGDSATILKTTSGGTTWLTLHAHDDPTLYSGSFPTSTTGWMVGDFGTVLKTTNAGAIWFPESTRVAAPLLKVQFLNTSLGWAVGYNGIIVKSTDGGVTWKTQTSGTTRILYSLAIVDANRAYVVGDFGLVLATTDGGSTWTSKPTGTLSGLTGVTFLNATTGWVVGEDGTILYTADGGTTWTDQNSGTLNTLYNIQLISTGSGGALLFVLGTGGTLLSSSISPLPLRVWTGSFDSLWTSAGNWNPVGVPEKMDSVYIPPTANSPVIQIAQQQLNLASLHVGSGAGLKIWNGLAMLSIKGSLAIDGSLTIDAASNIEILLGGSFLLGLNGKFNPGNSTVTMDGAGLLNGNFNNLTIDDGTAIQSRGNIDVANHATVLGFSKLVQHDTLFIRNSDAFALQGPGIVSGGTIRRAVQQGSPYHYRFESDVTYIQFYPGGTLPDSITETVYPATPGPGLDDSLFVKRYYSIITSGGAGYMGALQLRYDTSETGLSVDNIALFSDSSGILMNLGRSDFLDSDLVAIELDSVSSFGTFYMGSSDFIPTIPGEFTDSLMVSDNGTGRDTLVFGADIAGTDSLDPALGEVQLGPIPPTGTFDARWAIPPGNGSHVDFRALVNQSHQQNVYSCTFQPGPGGYPITLRWDSTVFPFGTVLLQDGATQGGLFNINMKGRRSFVISSASITSFRIVHQEPTFYPFAAGWNMISIPVIPTGDPRKIRIFPLASSSAFGYSGAYYIADTLDQGVGYWIKLPNAQSVGIEGLSLTADSIAVFDGWNMIGSITSPVGASSVAQNPSNIVRSYYYNYSGGYEIADSILPSKAYWVKISGGGQLILRAGGPNKPAQPCAPGVDLSKLNVITISDRSGGRQHLYFGTAPDAGCLPDQFQMPPAPPAGMFDARFATNSMFAPFPAGAGSIPITVRSAAYPLTLEWHLRQPETRSLTLRTANGTPLVRKSQTGDGKVNVADRAVSQIILSTESVADLPEAYALYQNYPNPFNPTTVISFDLPSPSSVTLAVFNILGQKVGTIADHRQFAAGSYSLRFDGSSLGSGVYYYRLTAQAGGGTPYQSVRKMLLLR